MSFPAPESKPEIAAKKAPDPDYFKDAGNARKAMLALKAPISEEVRSAFLAKVKKSPVPRYIAFTLLAEGWKSKPAAAWSVVRTGLKEILAEGRMYPSTDVVSRTETRKKWLVAEFGITGKTQDSALYNANFGYLWPLFVILSFPDNEPWLAQALNEFVAELDASIEVGKGKVGSPNKGNGGASLSMSIALDIVPLVQPNALSIKSLKSHLLLMWKTSTLSHSAASAHEYSTRQVEVLNRLLGEEKTKVQNLEEQITALERGLADANERMNELSQKLAAADQQAKLMQGIADMRVKDALVEQRADLRFKLRQGLGNIKLYTDRPEPAKDRVLKLCDELIAHLESNPHR